MFSPVDKIKERLNIVDVISMYINLIPAGKNFKAKSPFKNEKTPSFFVSPDKGLYHCFSTGRGGDMFTFVQEMEGLDFKGALRVLADKAGVSLKDFNPKEKEEKDKFYEIMEEATLLFEKMLSENKEVFSYIKDRGLEDSTIKEFRIGYVPLGWRNLYDVLSKKYSDEDLEKVGLIKKTDKGAYDTFRDRIMFPLMDSSGRVVAFSGRIFKDDGKSGKYVNSPDTPIFSKSNFLYGIDKAKNYIRKYNFTTIVEGQFDLIMLHQFGFKNTVAVSGTALAEEETKRVDEKVEGYTNIGLIKRLSNNLVLAFDSDSAGVNAARRSANIALSMGMDAKIIDMPEGKDPADFLKENGKEKWSELLRSASHVIEFYTSKIVQSSKDKREIGRRIKEEVLPEVAIIESDIEKSYFIKKISEITGLSEADIKSDASKIKLDKREVIKGDPPPVREKKSRVDLLEKKVMSIYYIDESKDIKDKIVKVLTEDKFSELNKRYGDKKQQLVFEAEVSVDDKTKEKIFSEILNNLEEVYLNERLSEIESSLKDAESQRDDERAEKLVIEYQSIARKLQEIKNSRHINNYPK